MLLFERTSAELAAKMVSLGLEPKGKSTDQMEQELGLAIWAAEHPGEEFPSQYDAMLAHDATKATTEWLKQHIKSTEYWIQEKLDGMRSLLVLEPGKPLRMHSRSRSEVTYRYEEHGDKVLSFQDFQNPFRGKTVLDGELLSKESVVDTGGKEKTAARLQAVVAITHAAKEKALAIQQRSGSLLFHVFDVLFYNGRDVRDLPYESRIPIIEEAVQLIKQANPSATISVVPVITEYDDPIKLRDDYIAQGKEGIMLKRRQGRYEGDRSYSILKFKREMFIDAWISGPVFSKLWNQKEMIAGFQFSSNVENEGVRVVASITSLDLKTRKAATVTAPNMTQYALNPEWLNRVYELKGARFSPKSRQLEHARMIRPRTDKRPEECFISQEMIALKEAKLLTYRVAISKYYFPRVTWPEDITEFQDSVKVQATSRTDAVKRAWSEHGERWAAGMAPIQNRLGRIVSLHADDPTAGVGGQITRLPSIRVAHFPPPANLVTMARVGDEQMREDVEKERKGARVEIDTAPTEQEKRSGSYDKGELSYLGLSFVLETPKGSVRSGKSHSGESWEVRMPCDYGYFKHTDGADGDEVDVFVGPDLKQDHPVYVIHQVGADTQVFDEDKVLFGFPSESSALAAYDLSFSDGKGQLRRSSYEKMTVEQLKQWLHGNKE